MMFKDKTILITGGTGSWGQELTTQLLEHGVAKIVIFSRGEIKQVEMARAFLKDASRLKFVIGDVRDSEAVQAVMKKVNIVFHLAALKHVPICEEQPEEAIKSNITGTINLVAAALINNVEKFIDVSTDKAVEPLNLYGMTKAIGEKIVINANHKTEKTDFLCIRAGNVLGTNGSVVPYLIEQLTSSNSACLTDPDMTRFFLPIKKAIRLLLFAAAEGFGGEIYVMQMPSVSIITLAKVLAERYGDEHAFVYSVGARPGEKMHEVLISEVEKDRAFDIGNGYMIIKPEKKVNRETFHYWDHPDYNGPVPRLQAKYSSENHVLGYEDTKILLKEGGFL